VFGWAAANRDRRARIASAKVIFEGYGPPAKAPWRGRPSLIIGELAGLPGSGHQIA